VNSPVRAYGSVGGEPPFIERGEGAYFYDADGNRYVDYVLSWGPMILGHAHPAVVEAVKKAAEKGTSFGAPTEAEVELAELVKKRMPHVEMLRLVNSGTEAVMTAARLARGFTGRDLIVKFDGCYHGHSDGFLTAAGSGVATGGLPGSAGVPEDITRNTLSLIYNDLAGVEKAFGQRGGEIAAVIVEPIAANMGVVPPQEGFLQGLRELTSQHGALLIFDEVITCFRVARGGASELCGVIPDLVCLGKILGGGLPTGAVGGRGEIMERLAPSGDVYQAGTLSGNPISVAAGIATLKELDNPALYANLGKATEQLAMGLREKFDAVGIPVQVNQATGLLTVFFSTGLVTDFSSSKASNAGIFCRFFGQMLENSIYLPPSPFEAWFLSTQHGDEETAATLCAAEASIEQIKTTIA
jgi:glutamate-1-semialdehyde 2,1-aminomutase